MLIFHSATINWRTLVGNCVANIKFVKLGRSGYCTMFMPIIAILPFATVFYKGRNTINIHLNIEKTSYHIV